MLLDSHILAFLKFCGPENVGSILPFLLLRVEHLLTGSIIVAQLEVHRLTKGSKFARIISLFGLLKSLPVSSRIRKRDP